jgi:hypothetical protein
MLKRLPTTTLMALMAAFASAGPSPVQWVSQNFFKRIFVSGHREIGLHLQHVSGDHSAFNDLNYSGLGAHKFTNTGQVSIDGRNVLGVLNFQFQIADDRYSDPENRRISVDYNKGPISVSAGDIRGSMLNTNQFASFNRSLKGVSAGYKIGRFAFRGVTSQAKGSATTISVQGDNSVGPYYLQNSRIAKDSVQVMVDGQPMTLGSDYIVNYDIGSITFQNKIIAPTSTIVVTYESLSFNASRGTVRGLGAAYDLGKFGKLGISSLSQDPVGVQGLSQRTDLFQGFGDPSTPYTLTYEPLTTIPVIVKLQGIIQTENVQYRFDPNNPAVFYFLFPVPSTSNVDVTYTPKPIQTVDGKRRVTGFDYTLPFGGKSSRGSLVYNQATGSLDSAITPMSGTARSLALNYSRGPLQLRSTFKDIPNTFVGIESTGFLRNEKSMDFSATNARGPLSYGLNYNNSLIGTRNTDNSGALIFKNARTSTARAFLNFAKTSKNNWTLQQIRTSSRPAGSDETRLDTTSLSNSNKQGRLSTNVSYNQTKGVAPLTVGTANVVSPVSLNTLRFSSVYNAGAAWALGASVGLSDVKAGAQSGHGNDISMNAEFKPSQKLDVQLLSSQSTSGSLPTLEGFQSGFGLGYGGNGFSSGISSVGTINSVGNNYRSNLLSVTYQVSPKMNVATRFNTGSSSGTIASNSSFRSASFDMDWDLGRGHTTGLSLTNSHTTFLANSSVSNATTLDWFIAGTPKGPWSYRLGTNYLVSGGATQFGQNSFAFDASALRKITAKQRLGFAWHSGRTTGYLPQNENMFELFHEYQIYQNIALRTSYTWRKVLNSDPTLVAGAYQAHGLDVNLTFDFAP